MGITLDTYQEKASELIQDWYKGSDEQTFILAGLAGTGKSTIISYVISELGINEELNVAYCAFTGKAAMVLRQKGIKGASTIHRLIYKPYTETDKDGNKILKFERREELPASIELIVVDEASMISRKIQEDLESYNVPIVYVGDHGQLPPVGDSFSDLMSRPNVKLEKIHRQAEGNPIIQAAMRVRQGNKIPMMTNLNNQFIKVPQYMVKDKHLTNVEQVICGKNVTRAKLNQEIRRALNIGNGTLLPVAGDRMICLRNDRESELINGMMGITNQVEDSGEKYLKIAFNDEEGYPYQSYAGLYRNRKPVHITNEDTNERIPAVLIQKNTFLGERPDMHDKDGIPFDFAYAITTHKSQGSQYDSILIYEEWLGDFDFHKRWLYTAITRGINRVILASTK